MASSILGSRYLTAALLAGLAALLLFPHVQRLATCIGYFRTPGSTPVTYNADGFPEMHFVENTSFCEDLHYHEPTKRMYTACDDSEETRYKWFPPLEILDDPVAGSKGRGSLKLVDPKNFHHKTLILEDFDATFVTHGIDVTSDLEHIPDGVAVYILAVNHVPHPSFVEFRLDAANSNRKYKGPKTSPRIEIFRHVRGSATARHIRTVMHPLIKTPNDIYAVSPTSFYVTNDHYYEEGALRRLEQAFFGAKWGNVVHVRLDSLEPSPGGNASAGVDAVIALSGIHTINGLGHGKGGQILIASAVSAELHVGELPKTPDERTIKILGSIKVDSTIDNPSYFQDALATESFDATGYVLAGLTRAVDLPRDKRTPGAKIPVSVWYVKPNTKADRVKSPWERRLLFEDDGGRVSSATTAVLFPIPPAVEGGKRKAWLFVTGFASKGILAFKVRL